MTEETKSCSRWEPDVMIDSPLENNYQNHDFVDYFDRHDLLVEQMKLLGGRGGERHDAAKMEELRTTPVFSMSANRAVAEHRSSRPSLLPQFGLLAQRSGHADEAASRLFQNVNAPWSAFICGSQGSGKSHSLSCMLENCMLKNPLLGELPKPLTALIFHYDSFTSSASGQACEAAYLCSYGLEVTVLVAPTNLPFMTELYRNLPGLPSDKSRLKVEPLILDQKYLNVGRLLTLMSADKSEGPRPLYMQSVLQILREMALDSNRQPGIDYEEFEKRLTEKKLTPAQLSPLAIRLDCLKSFIAVKGNKAAKKKTGNNWTPSEGKIIIVDLSCPLVDSDTACGLFEVCLGVFLEQEMTCGRIVAMDEAHKFMNESDAASKLTESLISVIRLQRHLACRVIIATQEPTISPKLLDLCSFTLVHRFTSPEWYRTLKAHLAAAALKEEGAGGDEDGIFSQIVRLNAGEALLFAPSAMLDLEENITQDGRAFWRFQKLGLHYLHVCIRGRLTSDGGKSICAV